MDAIYPFSNSDFEPSLETAHNLRIRQDNLADLQDAANSATSLTQLIQNGNLSSREYDAYVYSLGYKKTGCNRKGALPVPLAADDTCLPGWYCPHSDYYNPPQFCPPTEECQVLRMNRATCGRQGAFEPKICDTGSYCPPGGKEQIPCPAGTFCPSGSVEPFNCSLGAVCPRMSQRQIVTVPVGIMAIIDVALLVFVSIGFGISRWRKSRPKRYTTLEDGGHEDNIELLRAIASPSRASMQVAGNRPPSLSVSSPGNLPFEQPQTAWMPPSNSPHPPVSHSPDVQQSPYASNAPSPPAVYSPYTPPDGEGNGSGQRSRASTLHARRASGRVDHMDGYVDDDDASVYSALSEVEDEFHNSADMLRFIRSMTKTIETSSIGLSFDFENLSFTTKKGKKILQEVTGTMPRGSCWGIMGGSGAGKSTFVNVLMGKQKNTGGTVKINGWEKDMSKYKKLIGYVPQDDIVFPELTVRENILHSARVRLPKSWRDKAIQDHVDALIACLQLAHVQHSRVGDSRKPIISGGQRKRVNIGIELAAAPMAIFLDEPTSGLDATSAASIMRMIKAISKLGVTTIAIIHQPREQIFYGFDQLLLLAQGRSVYAGPTEEVQTYFEGLGFAFPQRANPADTLIDIITGDGGQYTVGAGKSDTDVQTLIAAWIKKGQYGAVNKHLSLHSLDPEQAKRNRRISNQSLNSTAEQEQNLLRTMKARGASWPAQVFYCFKRAMTQQVRNATSFFFEIGVGGLAGVIIGLSAFASNGHLFQGIYKPPFTILSSAVDYSSTPQIGLLGAMAIGLAASAPGFWVFGEEKQMYYRETASGHSRSAYYVGKLLSTLLRIALSSLHFTVFLGILATPLMSFTDMYLANLAYFFDIYGLASVVSMVVKREDGPLIAVLMSLIIGVLGGVAPPLSKVKEWHMEWFWRLSPGVWFTEAYWTRNTTPLAYLYEVELASQTVGFTTGQFALDVGMLVLLGCIYRIVAYAGLILVHRDRQR